MESPAKISLPLRRQYKRLSTATTAEQPSRKHRKRDDAPSSQELVRKRESSEFDESVSERQVDAVPALRWPSIAETAHVPETSRLDSPPPPDPIPPGTLPPGIGEKEYVNLRIEFRDLMRAETVLLRFAKTMRYLAHALKANTARLQMAEEIRRRREAIPRRGRESDGLKRGFHELATRLPKDGPTLPNPSRPTRVVTSTTTRRWNDEESKKLLEAMQRVLIQTVVQRHTEVAQAQQAIELGENDFKKARRQDILALRGEASAADFVVKLLDNVDTILQDKRREDTNFDPSAWWMSFWDTVASHLDFPVRRTGREAQIHFIHWLDPRVNHQTEWTKSEEARLLNLVQGQIEDGKRPDWDHVAEALGSGRTKFDVYHHYQTALNTDLTSRLWTPEQDAKLLNMVAGYTGQRRKIWRQIAEHFEDKSNEQCRGRYEVLSTLAKRGNWSPEEDIALQVLVSIYGRGQWAKVAAHIPYRTDIKCRERYENMLAPEVARRPWSEEESERLLQLVKEHGPGAWAILAENFEGRTDADLWRQWQKLDPLGMVDYGGARVVKRIFIPTQVKLRGATPALEEKDFSCEIAEQLAVVMKRILKQETEAETDETLRRSRRRNALRLLQQSRHALPWAATPPPPPLSLPPAPGHRTPELEDQNHSGAWGFDPSPAALDAEKSQLAHRFPSIESELQLLTRLAYFKYFIEKMSTGNKDADLDLNAVKKALLRRKINIYGFPEKPLSETTLTKAETDTLNRIVSCGVTIAHFLEYEERYGPPGRSQLFPDFRILDDHRAQHILRELLFEFSRGKSSAGDDERQLAS